MTNKCKHSSWQNVPMNGRKCHDCGMWLDEETAISLAMSETVKTLGIDALRAVSWFPSNMKESKQ